MNPALAALGPQIALYILALARVGGVVAVSPIPWANAPQNVRVGLILVLAALVQGLHPVRATASLENLSPWTALHLIPETLIGAAMGLVVRLVAAAADVAGDAITTPMGLSAAQAFDPTMGTTDSVLTRLVRQLALLVAIAAGLHHALLAALLRSFQLIPVGSLLDFTASLPLMLELTGNVIAVGARLALPVLAVLLIVNLSLGFASRAAPAMQIFSVGFAVLLATGAAVLLFSLPELAGELEREMTQATAGLLRLLEALQPL